MHPPVLDEGDVLAYYAHSDRFNTLYSNPTRKTEVEQIPVGCSLCTLIAVYPTVHEETWSVNTTAMESSG